MFNENFRKLKNFRDYILGEETKICIRNHGSYKDITDVLSNDFETDLLCRIKDEISKEFEKYKPKIKE